MRIPTGTLEMVLDNWLLSMSFNIPMKFLVDLSSNNNYLIKNYVLRKSYFFKGGYLHFSHLTELKNIYITEIYMRKQYKSSKIKN